MTAEDRRITVAGTVPEDQCGATEAISLAARRGGEVIHPPLTKRGCELQGTIAVSERGRWFIYAELRRYGRAVEAWLPVTAGISDEVAAADRYAYFPAERSGSAAKWGAGALLYVAMLALLYWTFVLIRSTALGAHGVR